VEDEVRSVTIIVDSVWLLEAISTPFRIIVIAIITVLSIITSAVFAPVITSVSDVSGTTRSMFFATVAEIGIASRTMLAPYRVAVYFVVTIVRCTAISTPFAYSYAI
jgi:hypothetical protein